MTYVDPLRDPEPLLRRVYAYVAYRIGDGPEAEDVVSAAVEYRIGDGPEAEDVVSAAVERALRYRASYRPELGEPIAWLLGIAKRSLRDHYAQREREDVELSDVADATDVESDTVERVTLQHAVARLSGLRAELEPGDATAAPPAVLERRAAESL